LLNTLSSSFSRSRLPLLLVISIILFGVAACSNEPSRSDELDTKGREVPDFQPDSAYQFIKQQVDMGPRHPKSKGHEQMRKWLGEQLRSYAGSRMVYEQKFQAEGYDGEELPLSNFVAAFNPNSSDRIMLCAHWDTRPRADMDSVDQDQPILGADDGGSGVGVLLELARLFKEHEPPVGVDLIFFDGEDYGREGHTEKYFLGSRYWVQHPPVPGYNPRVGILLDMVGAKDATFYKEQISLRYGRTWVHRVWDVAADIGYEAYFVPQTGAPISDDHMVINQNADFPVIDIINHGGVKNNRVAFPAHWHTHGDNLSVIDRQTLNAVGSTLTELIYNRL
jgi:glutaminyl-peptide cyclotransferase